MKESTKESKKMEIVTSSKRNILHGGKFMLCTQEKTLIFFFYLKLIEHICYFNLLTLFIHSEFVSDIQKLVSLALRVCRYSSSYIPPAFPVLSLM